MVSQGKVKFFFYKLHSLKCITIPRTDRTAAHGPKSMP